ncbi:MAG: T9SS type A sorting domain-containing protein [Ignavibacteriaceae bacterium]
MKKIRMGFLFLSTFFVLCNFGIAQTPFELISHSYYGITRSLDFDSSYKNAFSLAGNTFIQYEKEDSFYIEKFHRDFQTNFYTQIKLLESSENKYIFAVAQNEIHEYQINDNQLSITATIPTNEYINPYGFLLWMDKLFITLENRINIYSLENITKPALIDSILFENIIGATQIDNSNLYVTLMTNSQHKIMILNNDNYSIEKEIIITDYFPSDIQELPFNSIQINENRIFVKNPYDLFFEIDISNNDTTIVTRPNIDLPIVMSSFAVCKDKLYIHDSYNKEISVYDLSTPGQYNFLKSFSSNNDIWNVIADPIDSSNTIVTIGSSGIQLYGEKSGLMIYKKMFSDPTSRYLRDILIKNDTLFFTDQDLGLVSTRLSETFIPEFISNYSISARSFILNPTNQSIGYLTNGDYSSGGLYTMDLSKLSSINAFNFYNTGGGALHFNIHSNFGYLLSTRDGEGIYIFDLLDKEKPVFIKKFETPGTPRQFIIKDDIGYLAFSNISGDGGLASINLSNPESPTIIDTIHVFKNGVSDVEFYKEFVILLDLKIDGNFAFIAGPGKVYSVYINDVFHPKLTGEFELFGGTFLPEGPTNIAEELFIKDHKIFVAGGPTGLYVLSFDSTIVNIEDGDNKLLDDYNLSQNYPNPFNPKTTIKYFLPNSSFVTLKVYDILGKEITTLVNERKSAGNYSVNFNASNLPSGVYFYRMQAGNFVSTKKFVLLK